MCHVWLTTHTGNRQTKPLYSSSSKLLTKNPRIPPPPPDHVLQGALHYRRTGLPAGGLQCIHGPVAGGAISLPTYIQLADGELLCSHTNISYPPQYTRSHSFGCLDCLRPAALRLGPPAPPPCGRRQQWVQIYQTLGVVSTLLRLWCWEEVA